MGQRGPLRDPDSIRGQREQPQPAPPIQQDIQPPDGLTERELEIFAELVTAAKQARVPILSAYARGYAAMARLEAMGEACSSDPREYTAIQRTLQKLRGDYGLTNMSAARLGIKQTEKKISPTLQLLNMAGK